MARHYDLSNRAVADLKEIWIYTEEHWGAAQADRYYRDIIAAIEGLARQERQGRVVDLREGYLKYPVGRHMLYFTTVDARLRVVRILHQRMDVQRHLS